MEVVALVGGAALDVIFGELLKVVVDETKKTLRFKTVLKRLETTLKHIEPKIKKIEELSQELNHPEEETKEFICYLERGKKLVLKCSRIKVWELRRKHAHANKLIRLDDELLRFFHIDVPAGLLCNSLRNSIGIRDLKDKILSSRAGGFLGWCSVPGLPELIIGLDLHLAELKRRLLKEDTRVQVVSAPGGCGKTTLAKKLCHDDEIKATFGDNILYVTVSKTSSLKIIGQKLFHGQSHCEFQTDEEAKNQIENLIRKMTEMGSDKMVLLVLDDVWSETESLIQDLMFQIPGYKILVTSRFLFPRFNNSTYELSMLNVEDARTLFRYFAFPNDNISNNVSDDLVNKMVNFCKGLPLALIVFGASLSGRPKFEWDTTLEKLSAGESILQSNSSLLLSLQTSIDALDESSILRECFFDLGSFPEDDRIAGTALMDMWAELYNLDDEGMYASQHLLGLSFRNLINLIPIRKYAGEIEGYCSEHYVTQHDLLRDLAIHMSGQDPVAERKRLFMGINNNDFPTWWTQQTEQPLEARILSISTDEAFRSDLYDDYDLNAPNVEVLILNIRSNDYALPRFITRMSQLKVLIVIGYGVNPTQLENLSFLCSLSNLKRIRFEHVSISLSIQIFFELQNLKKLAFVTCKIGNASGVATYKLEGATALPNLWFTTGSHMVLALICLIVAYLVRPVIKSSHMVLALICLIVAYLVRPVIKFLATPLGNALQNGGITKAPYMLSNLTDIEINGCYDLKELPAELCSLLRLQKLTINNCNKMDALPRELGSLSNLQTLKLHGCTKLQELPDTIGSLHNLNFFDISDCLNIKALPEHIGELSGLRVLNMSGCRGIQELPESVKKLSHLDVICDDETSYMWKFFGSDDLCNVKINVVEEDRSGIFSNITR